MVKNKKIKQHKTTLINVVRKITVGLYGWLENLYSPGLIIKRRIKKGKLALPLQVIKMNRIMRSFYKRPEMQITNADGLQEVAFVAKDGVTISGVKFYCNPGSNKWVIASHWFGGNKYWSLYNALMFRKMGYNILSFDFRGHGKSEDDTTTMGAKEVFDLMGAITYLNESETCEHIALYGISMGAFTASYIGVLEPEFCKANKIKFGVCDSPYESIYSLMFHTRDSHLRIVPSSKTKWGIIKLLQNHNNVEKGRGVNLFKTGIINLIKREGKIPAFPILFLHVHNDKVTSPIDTLKVALARSKFVDGDEVMTIRYGTHALMTKTHFKRVERKIGYFIAKQDGTEDLFEQVQEELKLYIVEKRDRKSEALF